MMLHLIEVFYVLCSIFRIYIILELGLKVCARLGIRVGLYLWLRFRVRCVRFMNIRVRVRFRNKIMLE